MAVIILFNGSGIVRWQWNDTAALHFHYTSELSNICLNEVSDFLCHVLPSLRSNSFSFKNDLLFFRDRKLFSMSHVFCNVSTIFT